MTKKIVKPRPKMIVDPEWEEENAQRVKEYVYDVCENSPHNHSPIDYYPEDFGRDVGEDGSWILVTDPPRTEHTVPPFSIWFATRWEMEVCRIHTRAVQRVLVTTPQGRLGLMPNEYRVIDINDYLRIKPNEGALVRWLGDETRAFDDATVHYLMSRGIRRKDAILLLLDNIKSQDVFWVELHPSYGEMFGRDAPSESRCNFQTSLEEWEEVASNANK